MSAPIVARVAERPKPKRPRLYVAVNPDRIDAERYGTSWAYDSPERTLQDVRSYDLLFALPGSDEEWTAKKVREAAAKLWGDGGRFHNCPLDFAEALARILGMLDEKQT